MDSPTSPNHSEKNNHTLYSVWRQDEHGSTYCIVQSLVKEEAERLCQEYEARAHKQTYWVAPDAPDTL
jgi:hypothetical protein